MPAMGRKRTLLEIRRRKEAGSVWWILDGCLEAFTVAPPYLPLAVRRRDGHLTWISLTCLDVSTA